MIQAVGHRMSFPSSGTAAGSAYMGCMRTHSQPPGGGRLHGCSRCSERGAGWVSTRKGAVSAAQGPRRGAGLRAKRAAVSTVLLQGRSSQSGGRVQRTEAQTNGAAVGRRKEGRKDEKHRHHVSSSFFHVYNLVGGETGILC